MSDTQFAVAHLGWVAVALGLVLAALLGGPPA